MSAEAGAASAEAAPATRVVSTGVETGLVAQLQSEIAALRKANREMSLDLDEAQHEKAAAVAEAAKLTKENESLRCDVDALQELSLIHI